MSKKKTNKRLETLFEDVQKEETKPVKRAPKNAGALPPIKPPPPARLRNSPPTKAASTLSEEPLAMTTAVSNNSGAMSLAFRTDEKSWATLRVIDEESPRTWAMEDQMLVKQVADQLSLALENARLFEATRKSEQAVARSESELRALFSAMSDVIIVNDREGRYIRIAPTNPSRLFRPSDEMIGKKIEDVLPPAVAQTLMAAIHQALESNETIKVEYPLVINQKEYWFDGNVSKLNENGPRPDGLRSTHRQTHPHDAGCH
ncbi:MAG: PAS domain-containing protein [Chloroflexi bacterium]|nr:PAS domain-containing protein [Chloroflexota bacterium]